jgi:large subunit ribosomal protein L5e
MINQKKNRFNVHKYRLIVRFSNHDICSQIAIATVSGDKVICCAYGRELSHHGLKAGYSNYSAAYCVGLLCAHRCKSKFALNNVYSRVESTSGKAPMGNTHSDTGPRHFSLILDTGLKKTSTGSKVFATLKGAVDGGIRIPHNEKRFIGFDPLTKETEASTLKKYLSGSHIRDLMNDLKEEEPTKFRLQFASYISLQIKPEELSRLYEKVQESLSLGEENVQKSRPSTKGESALLHTPSLNSLKRSYDHRKLALRQKLAVLVKGHDKMS